MRLVSSLLLLTFSLAHAQTQPSERQYLEMSRKIRKNIVTLDNYGVFDDVTFSFKGSEVVLKGYASRPTLKDSAERVTKQVEGVTGVINQIEVLPLSPNDDRLRALVYRSIYGHPTLSRLNPARVRTRFPSLARMAGGITNDPPLGIHPIHIIVKNGDVILKGVVNNELERNIAIIQANSVPGVFSVTDDLAVPMKEAEKILKTK